MNLSINIVHTPGYNDLDLTKNKILQGQLTELAKRGIIINILVNGAYSSYFQEHNILQGFNVFWFTHDKYRLFLGPARNFLAENTTTKWYIQADEDDWFSSTDNILELDKILRFINTPLCFYRSECYDSNQKLIRRIPQSDSPGKEFRFYRDFAIDNTCAYNTSLTKGVLRPVMNNGVDNMFTYLCSYLYPNAFFIDLPIYHYNEGDAKMTNAGSKSKIPDEGFYYLDHSMTFNIINL